MQFDRQAVEDRMIVHEVRNARPSADGLLRACVDRQQGRCFSGLAPGDLWSTPLQVDRRSSSLDELREFAEQLPLRRRVRFGARDKHGKGTVGLRVEFHKRDPGLPQERLQRIARVEHRDALLGNSQLLGREDVEAVRVRGNRRAVIAR